MSFSELLKQCRKKQGVSQAELASRLGVTQQAVGKWESGKSSPDPSTVARIAELLNTTADYLLGLYRPVSNVSAPEERFFGSYTESLIPVIGTVKAGYGALAFEEDYGQEYARVKDPANYFYLVVRGDSMEPRIQDGDLALVHKQDTLENGDLLCCWFAGSREGNADISIAVARLPADAEQWEQPVIVSDDPTRSEQNPSLFQNPNGDIWLMYTAQAAKKPDDNSDDSLQGTAEIRRKISRDGGRTWGPTEAMFTRPGSFCRQKIQVLSNGRWIFNNFICALDGTRLGSDVTVIQISDDQGKTWRGVEVPESRGRVHGNIIELEPGKLVCLLRSRAADHIYRSESNDNGETWSVPVPTPLRNNNASISAIKLQSGALAIIYNDVSFNEDGSLTVWPDQRCPVAMAISEDGGKTWPWRRIVEHGEGFIGPWNDVNNRRYEYPVMMQSKDGSIHAAYAWGRRVRIKYVCVDEAWIRGAKVCKGAEDNPEMPCNR